MATPTEIIDAIRTCYCAQFAEETGIVCCISAGEPVVLSCCPGQAWVRIVEILPSGTQNDYAPCGPVMWRMQVELGISRCAPEDCGPTSPSCCEAEEEVAFEFLADRAKMMRALSCCEHPVMRDIKRSITFGAWRTDEPEGACVSSTLQVYVTFIDSCRC